MSKIQQSLQDNLADIKANLPEEFHADLEKMVAEATDAPAMSAEEEADAVKAELYGNPDVDDAEWVDKVDVSQHAAPAALSAEEQEAAMKAELEAVKKEIG